MFFPNSFSYSKASLGTLKSAIHLRYYAVVGSSLPTFAMKKVDWWSYLGHQLADNDYAKALFEVDIYGLPVMDTDWAGMPFL